MRYSIVIPTYGRPERLRECLRAIADLDYDLHTVEVVVVDDGDHEETRTVVASFGAALRGLYIAQRERAGPAAARNAGARAASGMFLVFLDDDCIPYRDWLRGFDAGRARAGEGSALGGRVVNAVDDNAYAAASQSLMDFLYEWYNDNPVDARFFATNNLLCPREGFTAMGGFDEAFSRAAAEDRDFCDRWRESGRRIASAPEARVRHYHRLSFRSFVLQHFGYGRGALDLHLARDRRGVARPDLEPARFYRRLVSYPLRPGMRLGTLRLSALAILSQVAYAAGYYHERFWRSVLPRSLSPRTPPPYREAAPASVGNSVVSSPESTENAARAVEDSGTGAVDSVRP